MPKPFFNEVAGLCNFIKFFFAKFVRTPFLTEHLRWLLLTLKSAFEICQLPFSYAGTWELVNLFVGIKIFTKHICYENLATQCTHSSRRFAIDSTSKFHVESLSRFHQLWKVNPGVNYDILSTWKFRREFDFQNRWNIDEFSTWIFLCCFNVEST